MHRVQALLQRWCGDALVSVERMGMGGSTPVYRVTTREAVGYLRLAEHPGEVNDGEVRAHELARQRGVRVPDVVRWEAHPPELDRSAVLTSEVAGVALADVPEDAAATPGWARDGALLSTIPVRGWGWVTGVSGAEGDLVAEHASRAAWVAEYRGALQAVLTAKVLATGHGQQLAAAMTAWCDLPGGAVSWLAHGDLDPSHVYVDAATGAYAGLIDLGEIRGADALYDLGHALAHAFDARDPARVEALLQARNRLQPLDREAVRLQAVAIATRALAMQLRRPQNDYRIALIARLGDLCEGCARRD